MSAPRDLAERLVSVCTSKGLMIATAESCTGGMIAAAITDIAGSSAVLDRGFVTYSNEAKQQMTGVPEALLARYGAVSAEVARAMAEGALAGSRADLVVAVTGIAGPGGGSDEKPVGLVHLVAMRRGGAPQVLERRYGDIGRDQVRAATVRDALTLLIELV